MSLLELFLAGAALGFSLAAPPGPMNAWIAAAASRSSFAGVTTGLGAMCADGVLGAVVYSANRSVDLTSVVRPLDAVGAGVLVYLAVHLLRQRGREPAVPESQLKTFSRALALGLTNPFQVLWWLSAGLAFAYLGGAVLLVGLFAAIVVWVLAFPAGVRAGAQRSGHVEGAITAVAAATMVAFAAYFAIRAVLG